MWHSSFIIMYCYDLQTWETLKKNKKYFMKNSIIIVFFF